VEWPVLEVFQPLLRSAPYKGAKGGRSAGRSHFFASLAVEEMLCDPSLRFVCIREMQRSLKFSAKSLVEAKIREMGVERFFHVLTTEIRRTNGTGVMIFEGMQDHTADSIKSLEGFRRAWVEEAQSLSQRSLDLLIPTIRDDGSELWFSWNPEQPTDAIERFLVESPPDAAVVVHSNYTDNPLCPERILKMAAGWDPLTFDHVWMGAYNVRSEAIVLSGKWRVDELEPDDTWDGPYFGADWGFAQDPTVLTRSWVIGDAGNQTLYVDYDVGAAQIELDEIPQWFDRIPGARTHVIRADNARPETISYLRRRHGYSIVGADKWAGSVKDGVAYLRAFREIVIHPRCTRAIEEARLWRYKTNRAGDVLPDLVDLHNHTWDGIRYAHAPLIAAHAVPFVFG